MGMSSEEFEKQKADTSKRFYVTYEHPDYVVIDRSDGTEVGRDGIVWDWVVEALNAVHDERAKLVQYIREYRSTMLGRERPTATSDAIVEVLSDILVRAERL